MDLGKLGGELLVLEGVAHLVEDLHRGDNQLTICFTGISQDTRTITKINLKGDKSVFFSEVRSHLGNLGGEFAAASSGSPPSRGR